jgi:hypothetical protein
MKLDAVKRFKDEYKNLWWDSSIDFPAFDTVYEASRQTGMEAEMESFIENAVQAVRNFPVGAKGESPEWGADLRRQIHSAGVNALGFAESNMDMLLDKGFCYSTSEFIEGARRFDSTIKLDDIMQAMRNVWIMNCIQLMLDKEVGYTPPLFAYSMLYPYTDNYLDARSISPDKKAQTGKKLRLRLEGNPVQSLNPYEEKLFKLIEMIEGYYPRKDNPEVYESLLWIHDAQQNSLLQQKSAVSPYENDILDLSIRKGGASVLADAYLINGSLTPEEARFMFGFGIALQLGDDLQDALTDRRNGHMTLFSQTAGRWPLDNITNKLFNFTYSVLDSGSCLKAPAMKELSAIMKRSCTLLLLGAVANNSALFSKGYLKSIEAHSPLGFKYIRHMARKIEREYRSMKIKNAGRPVEVYMARALARGV